jgi:hypothetical protein
MQRTTQLFLLMRMNKFKLKLRHTMNCTWELSQLSPRQMESWREIAFKNKAKTLKENNLFVLFPFILAWQDANKDQEKCHMLG